MKPTTKEVKLTPKQSRFCELYASTEEFFANGVRSYAEAYGYDLEDKRQYIVAQQGASENLRKPLICQEINRLLELRGLNDQFVDKQLEFLITQYDDVKTKLGAIKEYNLLKQRVIKKAEIDNKSSDGSMTPVAAVDKSTVDELIEGLKAKTAKEAE